MQINLLKKRYINILNGLKKKKKSLAKTVFKKWKRTESYKIFSLQPKNLHLK